MPTQEIMSRPGGFRPAAERRVLDALCRTVPGVLAVELTAVAASA